jgi:acyl-CoA reductase-like NAD-dependent aldehyde dehydrogenase
VLPAHVVTVVTGGDDLGRWMTEHPTPRKVSFTGSTSAGMQVARAGALDLKRVTLELGGNDPAILLDDVDLDAAEASLFWSAFANNGQVCAAVKRVYAPRSRYDEVVERLTDRARRVVVGDGREPATRLGPVNNLPQLRRIVELTDDALHEGAVAVAGGRRIDGPGYFFRPTILAGARDGMRVVDEEQFGPVLPVVPYDDVDEVVQRANASRFGLSASVWSADASRAEHVADGLDCGTVWLNGHLVFGPEQPVGGARWSGIGIENGLWGLDELCDLQVVRRIGSAGVPDRGAPIGVG